jgi:hypothetical protein
MKKLWLTLLYAGIRLGLPVRNVVRYGVRSLSNPVQLYGCPSTSVRDASSTLTCSALWVSIVVCGAAVHNCVVAAVRRVQVPVAIYQVEASSATHQVLMTPWSPDSRQLFHMPLRSITVPPPKPSLCSKRSQSASPVSWQVLVPPQCDGRTLTELRI